MRISGIPYVQGINAYRDVDGAKYGIAIHNTANDATAEGEASYATWRTDRVSAHFYCDADSIVQSLDTDSKAGHAGSTIGNENAIAIEITGTNLKTRQWWLDNVAWDQLGHVLAVLCRHYGVAVRRASVAEMKANPKVRAFYGHDDMRLAWAGTTHTDPGANFPWDRLFAAVNAALAGTTTTQGDTMIGFVKSTDPAMPQVYVGDGITRRPVDQQDIDDIRFLAKEGWLGPLANGGAIRSAGNVDTFGALVGEAVISDPQVDRIAAALIAATDNPLGEADKPAIVSAVKQALREGAA